MMKRANVAEVIETLNQRAKVLTCALQGVAGECAMSIVEPADLNAIFGLAMEVEALAGRLQRGGAR